jgi:phosphoacetylglucosamine mutase
LFSPTAISTLKAFTPSSPDSANAIKHLIALSSLINQAVGDALSDMLLVEVVLAHRGWTAPEWDAAYEDLPNRLVKVEVKDRFIFETTDAERRLVKPEGLQDMVNDAMGKVEMGRSFVRPSGTEDCVRVYAEAKSSADAEGELCEERECGTHSRWEWEPSSDPASGCPLIADESRYIALASNVADLVRHFSESI